MVRSCSHPIDSSISINCPLKQNIMRCTFIPAVLTGLLFAGSAVADWPHPFQGCPDAIDSNQCPPAVVALATGIHLNIVGQEGELNATEALQTIEAASPVNQTNFLIGKGELLANVMAGMSIRKFNQAVAPPNNAALPGLAKYAAAQATELALAQSLTGIPSHDDPILATLVSDIHAGIMLNMDNLANVSRCRQVDWEIRLLLTL